MLRFFVKISFKVSELNVFLLKYEFSIACTKPLPSFLPTLRIGFCIFGSFVHHIKHRQDITYIDDSYMDRLTYMHHTMHLNLRF